MIAGMAAGLVMWAGTVGQVDGVRVDPFRSPLLDAEMAVTRREGDGPLTRYELEQLRVVGLVVNVGAPTALVEDPNGMGHLVRVGTLMGTAGAQVKSITRTGIVLEQTIHSADFRFHRALVNLPLAREVPLPEAR